MQNQPDALDQAIEGVKTAVTQGVDQLSAGARLRDLMMWLGQTFPGAFNEQGKPAEMMTGAEYRKFRNNGQ